MATWDELFKDKRHIRRYPQPEVIRFVQRLEQAFAGRPLKIWDQCCGGGRHSILVAEMGHEPYASDVSPVGIANLRQWASERNFACRTDVSDMTENPWGPNERFHGVVCWDALHHNTISNIKKAAAILHEALVPGGLLLLSLLSSKSGTDSEGREVEKNTFVSAEGLEAGVPHHYFDKNEIASVFSSWTMLILAEVVVTYLETEKEFYKNNPFPYTKWNLLLRRET
jgi:2-polyprenyl-3-methyl-5-hydroxy-6-metoxy-1,4-benzoquinol methylase